jgi:hypothetical protein
MLNDKNQGLSVRFDTNPSVLEETHFSKLPIANYK